MFLFFIVYVLCQSRQYMKNVLLILASIWLMNYFSCSDNETVLDEHVTIQRTVMIQDCHSDTTYTALEKFLSHIDEYNHENGLPATSSIVTFISSIDDIHAEIIQSTRPKANNITQKITTNCRVKTSYHDDCIATPDYMTRHYNRTLIVSEQENRSTAVRKYSDDSWSEWTYHTHYYKASPNHAKNIAIFGGSYAHNTRGGQKGADGFGFDYNGRSTSLQDLISEIFACKHVGNYAQSGQGVYIGTPDRNTNEIHFRYNMYEQVKYAFEYSKENGFSYDVFLLFGGINDCAIDAPIGYIITPSGNHSYIASFKKSIEYIRSNNPKARIYLITSFPVFDDSGAYESLDKYVNANIKLSKFYNLPLFDIYNQNLFTDSNYTYYYLADKIHPNGEGYNAVSSFIIELLN